MGRPYFIAKYSGRCGICKLRIRKGDKVIWIAPVTIKLAAKHDYGMLWAPQPRWISTHLAHRSCDLMMEGKEADYDE